jgi:UDP-N-acetylglucosamine--N-acetylmuramyl-(pentapeptide) pyrophosphoryl-undecaprenol N-acetylglucosamine transferase
MPMQRAWALVAGGGTGGHVTPAIAIAQALVAAGHDPEGITFVGSERGLEARLVPQAGFEVVLLPGRGIARRLTSDNVAALAGLAVALARAVVLVGRRRPRVVVAVGGYASVPAGLGAVIWRVPLVVAEQNAVPGLANRLLGRFARVCAVAFPGTPLPRAVVTGNPVRARLHQVDRSPSAAAAAREALGYLPDDRVVAVYGGSLGARRINEAVVGLARGWADRAGLAVHHVVGDRDFDVMAERAPAPTEGGLRYRQVRFEDRMDLLYSAAEVVVARAGASTVAELTVAGVPALLVPLPGAPGDHQSANARRLADSGAAVVVADAELDAGRLAAELDALLADPDRLQAMGSAARQLGRPDAAAAVAALVEAAAGA